jgi:hypothetical protein
VAFHAYPQWSSPAARAAWPAKHFTLKEFAQRGAGYHEGLSPVAWEDTFIAFLDRLRDEVGEPLVITSGYRSPEYNSANSHTGAEGPHTKGKAADFACDGQLAFKIISAALRLGARGVGVSQKGSQRFVHIDMITDAPRPNVWSY